MTKENDALDKRASVALLETLLLLGTLLLEERRIAMPNTDKNIQLISELLVACQQAYIILGDIHHQWPNRDTIHGQSVLANLRDAICAATGREAEDVQNDYCNRALARGAA